MNRRATVTHQAPLSMGFSRQEYWSGLTFPTPGDLPNSGIEPMSLASSALVGGLFTTEPPEKPCLNLRYSFVQLGVQYEKYKKALPWNQPWCSGKITSKWFASIAISNNRNLMISEAKLLSLDTFLLSLPRWTLLNLSSILFIYKMGW